MACCPKWYGMTPRYWAPLFAPTADPRLVERARNLAFAQPIDAIIRGVQVFHSRPDRSDFVTRLEVPVLIVSGQHDPVARNGAASAAGLRHGTVEVVAGAGHYVPLERPAHLVACSSARRSPSWRPIPSRRVRSRWRTHRGPSRTRRARLARAPLAEAAALRRPPLAAPRHRSPRRNGQEVDAEVLPPTLLPDSLAFFIGRREMQREPVVAVGSPEEHDRPVPELLLPCRTRRGRTRSPGPAPRRAGERDGSRSTSSRFPFRAVGRRHEATRESCLLIVGTGHPVL